MQSAARITLPHHGALPMSRTAITTPGAGVVFSAAGRVKGTVVGAISASSLRR
jgi:hypothetical protein